MPKGASNKNFIGIDEAGRGALCGPVVAGAVLTKGSSRALKALIFGKNRICDSKKLSPKKREEIFKKIKKIPNIFFGIGKASPREIEKFNILNATQIAMARAIKDLLKKVKIQKKIILILDGKITIPKEIFKFQNLNAKFLQKAKVKADEKIFPCALASILAKVTRDKIMIRYSRKYPFLGLEKHKGYPTKFHKKMIKKFGILPFYRKNFKI